MSPREERTPAWGGGWGKPPTVIKDNKDTHIKDSPNVLKELDFLASLLRGQGDTVLLENTGGISCK